jgi:hypothetical protein
LPSFPAAGHFEQAVELVAQGFELGLDYLAVDLKRHVCRRRVCPLAAGSDSSCVPSFDAPDSQVAHGLVHPQLLEDEMARLAEMVGAA